MNTSKHVFGATLIALALAAPAQAQFGGLPGFAALTGGGSKSGGADPAKIEQDLKSIIATTSEAMAGYSEALGLKEQAAKFSGNAQCIKAGSCGLSDGINVIESTGPSVMAEAEKLKASGHKLDANASSTATKALLPAAKAFPLWKEVADGVKSMDKASAIKFGGLVQAAPKVPTAAKGTVDVVNGAVAYLAFSGADTQELKSAAAANLKF